MCQKFNNQTASLTTQAPSIPAPIPRSIFPARSGIHSSAGQLAELRGIGCIGRICALLINAGDQILQLGQCALLPSLAYSQACGCAPARLSAACQSALCPFHFRPAPRSVPSSAPPAPSAPPPHRSGSVVMFFQIVIVIPDIVDNRPARQVQNPGCGLIDKITVVRYEKHGSGILV